MLESVLLLLEILLVNIVLSGDNAVVIAMASRNLPENLRNRAIWLGAVGAVVLRIILSVAAVALLDIPAVQIIGSLMLLYIAIQLLMDDGESKDVQGVGSLGKAVGIILVSDLVMSLDNVLAIASIAKDNMWLMVAGIALSIPLIIWGSQLILKLINRFPAVVWVGSAILGYTAGEMLQGVQFVRSHLPSWGRWEYGWLPVATAAFVLIVAWVWKRTSSMLSQKESGEKRIQ
ncbi:TerC family protein [Cohnella lupini]|uniref:YjbE family integral membrane protein n=1 Tax=Cohnella lupini TaxID=1294267 RepID=A0A3D9IKY9_9BACL|nr:TerC family protein [Cohnella lupini]RED61776.1 YjbE family integral membrane protein [Cohnella lupini]